MEMSLWRVIRKTRHFRAVRRGGLESILKAQREQLERLVAYARHKSPFYERLYRHLPKEGFDLHDLPVTNKAMLMEHFDEVVTDRRLKKEEVRRFAEDMTNVGKVYLGEFVVDNTSGTTGMRCYVAQHISEWETFFALKSLPAYPQPRQRGLLRRLLRIPFSGIHRAAVVAGTSVNFITPIAYLVKPRLSKRFARVELISTLLPVDEMVERLNRFQPHRLHGLPTMLEALAYKQMEGVLCINPVDVSSGGEPLIPRARRAMEEAFGVFVENAYGATEPWIMGKECPNGRMHLCIDGCILEPVDAHGQPSPPGQPSAKILVTNLYNFTQPFIRYEMEDSVIPLQDQCPCGSALPAVQVIGRQDDPFYFRRPDGRYIVVTPLQLETLMLEVKGHRMFQIRQVERNRIRINYVPEPDADPKEVSCRIHDRFSRHFVLHGLGGGVALEVAPVAEVERTEESGKTKQIASLVGPPEEVVERPDPR